MKDVVVVTGGGGFIGHHLVKRLMIYNKVVVLDNFSRGTSERLRGLKDKVIIIKCDITDYKSIEASLNEFDVKAIFHLAAINGTGNFYRIPVKIMNIGILGCKNILDYAKNYSVNKVITASSAEVYQECDLVPTPEDVPLIIPDVKNPRFSYGLSKIFTEYYSYHFGVENSLNISIFRPHNVFGPDMGLQHVIPQFIMEFLRKIDRDGDIQIETKGSLDSIRAFCYVNDIVDGIILLSESNHGVNVYNIGNTQKVSMRELLNLVAEILDVKYKIILCPDEHIGGSMLRCPDISKIEDLGFSCSVTLAEGLAKTIDWYQKNFEKLLMVKNDQY